MAEPAPRGVVRPSRGFLICLGAVAVLFPVAWWLAPMNNQRRNMALVDRYVALIHPLVDGRPEFERVRWITYTANDGCLLIDGEVDSSGVLEELGALVLAHPCPRPMRWNVEVVTPQERAKREQWEREEADRKAPTR